MKLKSAVSFLRVFRLVLSIILILFIIGGLINDRFAIWG